MKRDLVLLKEDTKVRCVCDVAVSHVIPAGTTIDGAYFRGLLIRGK